uniref:Uncharacterized protein n=1 Tax=Wuchereria bancrofti TaxID=6293 RepID=A0A1I8EU75_WUCBA
MLKDDGLRDTNLSPAMKGVNYRFWLRSPRMISSTRCLMMSADSVRNFSHESSSVTHDNNQQKRVREKSHFESILQGSSLNLKCSAPIFCDT